MENKNIDQRKIEFYIRKGRLERSQAVHRFLKKRYSMVKKYFTMRNIAKQGNTATKRSDATFQKQAEKVLGMPALSVPALSMTGWTNRLVNTSTGQPFPNNIANDTRSIFS